VSLPIPAQTAGGEFEEWASWPIPAQTAIQSYLANRDLVL